MIKLWRKHNAKEGRMGKHENEPTRQMKKDSSSLKEGTELRTIKRTINWRKIIVQTKELKLKKTLIKNSNY